MRPFFLLPAVAPETIALIDEDGTVCSYGELDRRTAEMAAQAGTRRVLLAIEVENSVACLTAYLGALRGGHAIILLPAGHADLLDGIVATYRPHRVFTPGIGWRDNPGATDEPLDPDLSVLLSTSGTTAAQKLVRLSQSNIEANAASIASYLAIDATERALMTLPFHYSFGLSVVHSHLCSGATLLVSRRSVADPELWRFAGEHGATSFSGVPHTFELLDSVGFDALAPPTLRTITQAGGRLHRDRVLRWAGKAHARNARFFVMYGQTEATARIAYLPPEHTTNHPDCIGVAIPGGRIRLVDNDGNEITAPDREGELRYAGPNVMMGYATTRADLSRPAEVAELATGDLAMWNQQGLLRLTGRRSRFLKLFGLRVALDELEQFLAAEGFRAVCGGTDAGLVVLTLDAGAVDEIAARVAARCRLPIGVISVREVARYPLLPSGKVDYASLTRAVGPPEVKGDEPAAPRGVRDVFAEVFRGQHVRDVDSFVTLGGDSLTYVQVSMQLSALLGHLPPQWPELSIARLERVERRRSRFHAVDTLTVLRCLAIISIVAGHFKVLALGSGAYALLIVAGFNFARFQLPAVIAQRSIAPVLRLCVHVVVPTVLFLAFQQVRTGRYSAIVLLLGSNLVDPSINDGQALWFIEALVQLLLLVALLLAMPPVRRLAERAPARFASTLLAVGALSALVGPHLWDTDHLFNRVPHMLLWVFALGIWLTTVHRAGEKILAALVAFMSAAALTDITARPTLTMVLSLTVCAMLAFRSVRLPAPLDRVVSLVGGASLFIYLTHLMIGGALRKLGVQSAVVLMLGAIAGGVLVWLAWEAGGRALHQARTAMIGWRARDRSDAEAASSTRSGGTGACP